MILDIKTYPAKILTKKAKKVGDIDIETKKLISDMVQTLYARGGAGLAANQVGVLKQIIVVDETKERNSVKIFINPKIINKKGEVVFIEGCLSLPGLEVEVKRPQKIEVEYLDRRGRQQKIKAEHLLARIICHEADHLNGKTLLGKLPLLKRLKAKRQLKKNTIIPTSYQ
jgi:peptide deformylase